MGRKRARLMGWSYDDARQEITAPWFNRKIPLVQVAQWQQDLIRCHFDLTGPWAGWRIRGKVLKGPNGERYSQSQLRKIAGEASAPPAPPGVRSATAEQREQRNSAGEASAPPAPPGVQLLNSAELMVKRLLDRVAANSSP